MNNTFPQGISAFKPNDKAPSFIKANISIKKADLIDWLNSQGDTVKLDLKESREGKYYLSVNDFTPTQKDAMQSQEEHKRRVLTDDDDLNLPF